MCTPHSEYYQGITGRPPPEKKKRRLVKLGPQTQALKGKGAAVEGVPPPA